jgi:hypothetical protein
MLRFSLCMLASSVLATTTLAQESLRSRLHPITGPIKDAGTLHLGTGTWTRRPSSTADLVLQTYVYVNTCNTGYYGGMQQGEVWADEGGIPNHLQAPTPSTAVPCGYDTNPSCSNSFNITGFQIGYCTHIAATYSTTIGFYDMAGPVGTNCPIPGTPTATFNLTGLPGSTSLGSQMCWLVGLDLTATTPASSFSLTATGGAQNQMFSWTFAQVGPSLPSSLDGPVIAGGTGSPSPSPCTGTDGTAWDNGLASVASPNNQGEEGTGMFNLDAFRIHVAPPGGLQGCFWFGGNPRGSFHLALYSDVFCGVTSPGIAYCFGDGTTSTPCPCGNSGLPCTGCNNSVGNGGAQLTASGNALLSADTLTFKQYNELGTSLSIFLQGTVNVPNGVTFGDGVRCIGGNLKRLYVRSAIGGIVSAPNVGTDPSVSAISAILGDTITPGSTRYYGVYYRDPNATFCPNPPGNTWNIGNGYSVFWQN